MRYPVRKHLNYYLFSSSERNSKLASRSCYMNDLRNDLPQLAIADVTISSKHNTLLIVCNDNEMDGMLWNHFVQLSKPIP